MEFPSMLYCWWLFCLCVEATNSLVKETALPSKKSSEFQYLTNNAINGNEIHQIVSPVFSVAKTAAAPTQVPKNIRLPIPEDKRQNETLDVHIINTDSPVTKAETTFTTENSYIISTIGKNSKFTVVPEVETTILSAENTINLNEGTNLIDSKSDWSDNYHLPDLETSWLESYHNSTSKTIQTSQETTISYKLNKISNTSDYTSSELLISNLTELETTILPNITSAINISDRFNYNNFSDIPILNSQFKNISSYPKSTLRLAQRPSFAGLGTTAPPRIKPGKPWPARPQDYPNYVPATITTQHFITNRPQYTQSPNPQFNQPSSKPTVIFSQSQQRPSFAGLGTTAPPRVKPGKPWPARPQDYPNYYPTHTTNDQLVTNRPHYTQSMIPQFNEPSSNPTIGLTQSQQRPSFAGLGTTAPPRVKPGKPWPARPEDYPNYYTTKQQDPFNGQQLTEFINTQYNITSPNSIVSVTQSDQRPNFAGLGTTAPPSMKPGKPWPASSEDYTNFSSIITTPNPIVTSTPKRPELVNSPFNNPSSDSAPSLTQLDPRPSFAGLGTTAPPRVKPGMPWPASPEDYANFSLITTTNNQIVATRPENPELVNPPLNNPSSDLVPSLTQADPRPSFAGLGTAAPPRVTPGKPWPASPEEYANFSSIITTPNPIVTSTHKRPELVNPSFNTSSSDSAIILTQSGSRPSFAGLGTTAPPRVKPGKPWPASPEDYANFSLIITTHNPIVTSRSEHPEHVIPPFNKPSFDSAPILTQSDPRPSFAGLGTTAPPRVKPGKPWPASPEDYANFSSSITTPNPIVTSTSKRPELVNPPFNNPSADSAPSLTQSDPRPSFAGLGTTAPPRVKPGKPWPASPEDYANFSSIITTPNPIVTSTHKRPELVNPSSNTSSSDSATILTQSGPRPSFAGLGTTAPPRVKPGKPWPASPEDYANFSSSITTPNPIVTSTSKRPELVNPPFNNPSADSAPSLTQSDLRPSFAGLGTTAPPRVKPGKPWSASPEDYANFSSSITTPNPIVTSTSKRPELVNPPFNNPSANSGPSITQSDPRPSFAGLGTTAPPRVKPGKPWPASSEEYAYFSSIITTPNPIVTSTPKRPELVNSPFNNPSSDSAPSLTQLDPRPSFAGLGTTAPPRVKPGMPWPASPEDNANFSLITTTNNQIVATRPENPELVNPPLNNPSSDSAPSLIQLDPRPSFAGLVTTAPPRVKPGMPWPASPEDYANFSSIITTPNPIVTSKPEHPELVNPPLNNPSSDSAPSLTQSDARPSFAGLATTAPPRVKPGKPWPARL
ncbi:uncharacterized protein [Diabrotica undecimpunctata]|uniref:uncharacterized protein n=1 Tax=Diabrotica undecimpunctata TaxID=50387 RepID=UPI003B63D0C0